MKKKKEQTVTLTAPLYNLTKDFPLSQAETLLNMGMERNGGWVLPKNSIYTYSEENGLRRKANTTNTTEAS